MDYLYENLGDERFQEFCQVLLSLEYPNVQSFPTGQPDGGRDILVFPNNQNEEFDVYQVKYVKNPQSLIDPHKWLIEVLKEEAPKVAKLIPQGARNYYLLTNVKGTSHLETGSIDKVNKILKEHIPIPAFAFWRDDLSRKIEAFPLVKWSFVEIINGQDALNSVVFQEINSNENRRKDVIKSYLVDQYEIDNEVKFKQIDLQSHLLDLFIDVPIREKEITQSDKIISGTFRQLNYHYFHKNNPISPAADFLLSYRTQKIYERILLEGGPGQGKSTISQYVCQIHRIRLLNKNDEIEKIPHRILQSPIRLPFKIDLRDIASWIERKNPYAGTISDSTFTKLWHKSLEAFLVAHIFYHSGMEQFDTTDLISVCKKSALLIVFDGFDEIANVSLRDDVVNFINKGLSKIKEHSKSIQVIITSRPAAFLNSKGFSEEHYPHFELADVSNDSINEYIEKWIKSKRLDQRQSGAIRKLAKEKLQLPHLKDLAKSPMQLAILINLLNTRGESLPNKRTALYESYIDLFFNRESEKNSMIRDHRDLIIDIHQYLAWVLHSEAELLNNSGRVSLDILIKKVSTYLSSEGHDPGLSESLFDVMKERVCALVSRVQGTFEFEVQPLREYFCAKYLYNTAPYSPPGDDKPGAKTDRFDAIVRNYYWQNVVRFFSGCFDKGELPMLIQKLNEMQEDPVWMHTTYPIKITSLLLSDWVFTHYPNLLKSVVKIIVTGLETGIIQNQDQRWPAPDPIIIPAECGRELIVKLCFQELETFPREGYANELIAILKNNPYGTVELWGSLALKFNGDKLTRWIAYGQKLQVLKDIEKEILLNIILKDHKDLEIRLTYLLRANRLDIFNDNAYYKEKIINSIIENKVVWYYDSASSLAALAILFNPLTWANLPENTRENVSQFIKNRYTRIQHNERDSFLDFDIIDSFDSTIKSLISDLESTFDLNRYNWSKNIEPWDMMIEKIRTVYGDAWGLKVMATIAAQVKSKTNNLLGCERLHDPSVSLCKRVRYARLRSGAFSYWRELLSDPANLDFSLLVFFTWATPRVLSEVGEEVSQYMCQLDTETFQKICDSIKQIQHISMYEEAQVDTISQIFKNTNISWQFKYVASFRLGYPRQRKIIYDHFPDETNENKEIGKIKLSYITSNFLMNQSSNTLKKVKDMFSKCQNMDIGYEISRHHRISDLPINLAKKIMEDKLSYPAILIHLAEKSCRSNAYNSATPVGEIAIRDKWFDSTLV